MWFGGACVPAARHASVVDELDATRAARDVALAERDKEAENAELAAATVRRDRAMAEDVWRRFRQLEASGHGGVRWDAHGLGVDVASRAHVDADGALTDEGRAAWAAVGSMCEGLPGGLVVVGQGSSGAEGGDGAPPVDRAARRAQQAAGELVAAGCAVDVRWLREPPSGPGVRVVWRPPQGHCLPSQPEVEAMIEEVPPPAGPSPH